MSQDGPQFEVNFLTLKESFGEREADLGPQEFA
jgi:hypothetical protein